MPQLQRCPEGPVHKVLWPDLAACPGSPASNWAARAARSKIPVPGTVRAPSPGPLQPLADRSGAAAPPLRQEAEGLCNNPPATLLARRQTSAACAFRAAAMPRLVMRTHHALNLPGRRTGPATSRRAWLMGLRYNPFCPATAKYIRAKHIRAKHIRNSGYFPNMMQARIHFRLPLGLTACGPGLPVAGLLILHAPSHAPFPPSGQCLQRTVSQAPTPLPP